MYRTTDLGKLICALALGSALLGSISGQVPPNQRRPVQRPVPRPVQLQTQFKGIFEPVNYNQDLKLLDVFFVTAEEGWVSGATGTILHTTDGGKTWTPQLGGDPQAQGPDITRLFFLDRFHGWAQAYGHLYRTTDGQNWQEVGNDVRGHVFFISPFRGFSGYGDKIYDTSDGGVTWKEIFTCAAQAQIQGLTKQIRCGIDSIQFPSLRTGYGVGWSSELGGGVVVKSEDGGTRWRVVFIPAESGDQRSNTVFFLDENHGFVFRNTGMYQTTDGGNTWQGVAASLPRNDVPLKFADPEVGWVLAQLPASGMSRVTYTVDGGTHWVARDLHFPAEVYGFSLPQRDTAYIVGDHGMVYRYRIVPADYQVANMIAAPMMPGYDSQLNQDVATVRTAIGDLAAQMQKKLGIPVPTGIAGQNTSQNALQQTSLASGADSTQPSYQQATANVPGGAGTTQPGSQQSGPAVDTEGGFQQATSIQGQDPNQGGFQQSATTSTGVDPNQLGGFQQATAGGGVVASCCGDSLQNVQTAVGTLAADIPTFSGKFRNLNLITAGLQFVADLLQHASAVKQAFNNLRQAPDNRSATSALTALSNQVNGIPNNVNGGFVQDVSSAFPQPASAPTTVNGIAQPGTTMAQPTDQSAGMSQQAQSTQQQPQKKRSRWQLPQIPNIQIPH